MQSGAANRLVHTSKYYWWYSYMGIYTTRKFVWMRTKSKPTKNDTVWKPVCLQTYISGLAVGREINNKSGLLCYAKIAKWNYIQILQFPTGSHLERHGVGPSAHLNMLIYSRYSGTPRCTVTINTYGNVCTHIYFQLCEQPNNPRFPRTIAASFS